MKIRWTQDAESDLDIIVGYVARYNPAAAYSIDALLQKKATQLTDHPGMGRLGRAPGTRELVVHKNYILIYTFNERELFIVRVLHAAQQWPDETAYLKASPRNAELLNQAIADIEAGNVIVRDLIEDDPL